MFKKFQMLSKAIKAVKPNVPKTKIQKKLRDLKIETQKLKGKTQKLKQTAFEIKNKLPITFKDKTGKTESNRERFKRIQKENTKVFKGMIDKAFKEKKATGGRVGKMGGGMMGRRMGYSQGSSKGKIPTTPKEKSLAKLAPPKDRITFGDVVAGRTKGKRMQAKDGTGPEQFMRSGKEDPMRDRMKQPLKLKRSKALMLEDLKKSKFKKRKP